MGPEALRARLIASNIADPQDIEGCTPEEIDHLVSRFGPLPESYRDILSVIGHRAGRLVDDHADWVYFDQLGRINRQARDVIDEYAEDDIDPDVPEEALFIAAHHGEKPMYLLAEGHADSAVWVLDFASGRVKKVHDSVWAWIEELLVSAEAAIAAGEPEHNSRRAPDLQD
ncbi:SMI1/KNR4 family protein [Pelagibacterium montanilacus]|uniref:SMI1/KNR4 family protein n=1 Tax=Pelagibacterium montanilacus TaxID=2185280 RepID=UPI000F8C8373|nr:SMI1/KNR4 family protein [Pelagibacterium montanilacus]